MKGKVTRKQIYILIAVCIIVSVCVYYYQTSRIITITDEDIAMAGGIGVTPQMFGAKGDGITNDTKAVQAAIDYASKNEKHKTVFIPEGIYSVKDLRLKKNVNLIGTGEKSVLLADPSSKTWGGILHCINLDSFSIEGITFDGNKPIVPGSGKEGTVNIWIDTCTDVNIKNCIFQNNWYLGICIKSSNNIIVEDSQFINLDCGILTAREPSSNLVIHNNYFDGAEYSEPVSIYGMAKGYHENITITDNVIKNHTKGSGILVRAAKNVTIKNNTIENCSSGIYLSSVSYNNEEFGVYDTVIEDNIIKNTVCEGILIKNINNSKIINNTIIDAGTFSIYSHYINQTEIASNSIQYSSVLNLSPDMPFVGFSMTLNGITNSRVSNNSISIQDKNLNVYRSPISIGSGIVKSSNNYFENNTLDVDVGSVYREDTLNSVNNTFAYINEQ